NAIDPTHQAHLGQSSASITPLFDFRETFAAVDILNKSSHNLVINDIDVVNRTASLPQSDVIIAVDRVPSADFRFDVTHSFGPTLVTIRNAPATDPEIRIAGVIDNPIGFT